MIGEDGKIGSSPLAEAEVLPSGLYAAIARRVTAAREDSRVAMLPPVYIGRRGADCRHLPGVRSGIVRRS